MPPAPKGSLMGNPGSSLELVAADITQSATLLPEMFADVRALVIATAVKVAPKEGDTPDRAKYRQARRFARSLTTCRWGSSGMPCPTSIESKLSADSQTSGQQGRLVRARAGACALMLNWTACMWLGFAAMSHALIGAACVRQTER